jgi:peroxiredoxin
MKTVLSAAMLSAVLFWMAFPATAQNAAAIQERHHKALLTEITAYIAENPAAEDLVAAYETGLQTAYLLEDEATLMTLLSANLRYIREKGPVDVREVGQKAMLLATLAKKSGNKQLLNETTELVKAFAVTHPAGDMDKLATELQELASTLGLGDIPELQGLTVDGNKINLADYRGKVVLLDFWATWCPPCMAELPNLKKTYETYHAKGFEIIGVSGDRGRKPLVETIANEGMTWPNLFDREQENSLLQAFKIRAFPTIYLLDQEGKIVGMDLRGEELAREVARLLGEK